MAAVNAYGGNSIGCAYLREYVNYGSLLNRACRIPGTIRFAANCHGAVEKACSTCSDLQRLHGGCRSTAYAFHGRFDGTYPFFDVTLNDDIDLTILPDSTASGWCAFAAASRARARDVHRLQDATAGAAGCQLARGSWSDPR